MNYDLKNKKMPVNIMPELKPLSANLKRLNIGAVFCNKDFGYELEENDFNDFFNQCLKTFGKNPQIKTEVENLLTEAFILGLNILYEDYLITINNDEKIELKREFNDFFRICFNYFLDNTKVKNDYTKILIAIKNIEIFDKVLLDEITDLIKRKEINFKLDEGVKIFFENIFEYSDGSKIKMEVNKKYQIFISSTFIDLKEERQAAVEAILKKGHIPAGMELFTAGDKSQWTVIKKWIDESDIYLLILGGRYGSIDNETGLSYTEMEYNYAVKMGKPLFALILSDTILDKKDVKIIKDYDLKNPKYIAFKNEVKSKMCSFPDNIDQIKIDINHSLDNLILDNKEKMQGWIKGNI